ncbi:MAG: hypothetical protein KDA20_13325 [Phycisphaerales bacterium]|nr:hypothetical protein [Phycisphaerales bacterium]
MMIRHRLIKTGRQMFCARRKAIAIAAVVLILAAINLAVIGGSIGEGDRADLVAKRADTARAFLAAESGVSIVIAELSAGRDVPSGTITMPGGAQVTFETSAVAPPFDVTVRSSAGAARRTLVVSIE